MLDRVQRCCPQDAHVHAPDELVRILLLQQDHEELRGKSPGVIPSLRHIL